MSTRLGSSVAALLEPVDMVVHDDPLETVDADVPDDPLDPPLEPPEPWLLQATSTKRTACKRPHRA